MQARKRQAAGARGFDFSDAMVVVTGAGAGITPASLRRRGEPRLLCAGT
jgi:hypothetical protein